MRSLGKKNLLKITIEIWSGEENESIKLDIF